MRFTFALNICGYIEYASVVEQIGLRWKTNLANHTIKSQPWPVLCQCRMGHIIEFLPCIMLMSCSFVVV